MDAASVTCTRNQPPHEQHTYNHSIALLRIFVANILSGNLIDNRLRWLRVGKQWSNYTGNPNTLIHGYFNWKGLSNALKTRQWCALWSSDLECNFEVWSTFEEDSFTATVISFIFTSNVILSPHWNGTIYSIRYFISSGISQSVLGITIQENYQQQRACFLNYCIFFRVLNNLFCNCSFYLCSLLLSYTWEPVCLCFLLYWKSLTFKQSRTCPGVYERSRRKHHRFTV